MKAIVTRTALGAALRAMRGVIRDRSPKPVLQCVKIEARTNELELSGTNLEIAVQCRTGLAQVEQAGVVLPPYEQLAGLVAGSQDETVTLDGDGELLKFSDNLGTSKVWTRKPEDFPNVDNWHSDEAVRFNLPAPALAKALRQTLIAVADATTRYAFNGVLFSISKKRLRAVGTDGHVLSLVPLGKVDTSDITAIVPTDTLKTLVGVLSDEEEMEVAVTLAERFCKFAMPNVTIASNLIEGTFPPYGDIMPKDTDKQMTCSVESLSQALSRAKLSTTEETKGVRLDLGKHGLRLTARSPERGEGEILLPCKYEGEPMEIGFNPSYLLKALAVCGTEEVVMKFTRPNRPGLLVAGEFQYVVMPVNLH